MRLYRVADVDNYGPYTQQRVDSLKQFSTHVAANGQPSPICDNMMFQMRDMLNVANMYGFTTYNMCDTRFAFSTLVGMYKWFRNDIEFLVENDFRLFVIEINEAFMVKGQSSDQVAFVQDLSRILKVIKFPPSLDMARKGVRIRKREKMKCS